MAPSIYEDLRAHDEASDPSDIEERAGVALDEENIGGALHDYELEHGVAFNAEDSRVTTESTGFLLQPKGRQSRRNTHLEPQDNNKSRWVAQSPRILEDDGDDDVPASLLIEDDDEPGPSQPNQQRSTAKTTPSKAPHAPGPSARDVKARWETVQAQQPLHDEDTGRPQPSIPKPGLLASSPRERALWTWINATNLDHFMAQVYDYYTGAGIWCICLERFLNLLYVVYLL
jgi:autophagy-related protein 9